MPKRFEDAIVEPIRYFGRRLGWRGGLPVFCVAVAFDNATTALGTAAFLSVLMSACSPAVSATQFALLT